MKSGTGSSTLDFSEKAARRAALLDLVQHPLTLWPPAFGAAAAVGLGLFGLASAPAVAAIAVGGAGLGMANWAYRFFGKQDQYMQEHYAQLHAAFEKLKQQKSAELAADLQKLGCKEGQAQVAQFEDKFQNLVAVFRRVLSENELTFSRVVGTAEQVYKSGLENLERAVVLLLNTEDMDRPDIAARIAALEAKPKRSNADEISLKALREQAGIFDQTLQEVDELLAANEEALTTMDKAGNAAIRIKDRSASQTPREIMGEAMGLLDQMITRANNRQVPAITLEQDLKR
ncbi:MAG TPA: hypothetical protein VGO59_18945 [Verrucomicrobiae bacterium]|jgi:hypothetical protein